MNNHLFFETIMDELEGNIIEIGSSIDKNGSTQFFNSIIKNSNKFIFHTVDLMEKPYKLSKIAAKNSKNMFAYNMSGEEFLQNYGSTFKNKICYAYLDNFDWQYEDENMLQMQEVQKQNYLKYGLTLSNTNSANAHLIQTKELCKNVSKKCYIQFDDTYFSNNNFKGKGMYASNFLLDNNWTLITVSQNSIAFKNF